MTVDEAIKQQEDALADKWCPWSPELKQSIRLGIEALRRCKAIWDSPNPQPRQRLPGETPE